MANFSL